MRTLSVCVALSFAAALAAGGTSEMPKGGTTSKPTTTQAAPPEMKDGLMTLEVETFTLEDATVKDLQGATGGKAVLFDKETSSAKTTVTLKKGNYEVTVFVQGVDPDHDAFFLSVAGEESRLFPAEYGKVVAADPVKVEVKQDGAVAIALAAAETGLYLDKVVVKAVK